MYLDIPQPQDPRQILELSKILNMENRAGLWKKAWFACYPQTIIVSESKTTLQYEASIHLTMIYFECLILIKQNLNGESGTIMVVWQSVGG